MTFSRLQPKFLPLQLQETVTSLLTCILRDCQDGFARNLASAWQWVELIPGMVQETTSEEMKQEIFIFYSLLRVHTTSTNWRRSKHGTAGESEAAHL